MNNNELFDNRYIDTCYCKCGTIYRSSSKIKLIDGGLKLITKEPCPNCNESVNNCSRVTSDTENFSIG
jgi:hypothetical protein